MTNRLKNRSKNPTHQQMLSKGYLLKHPTKKQKKGEITAIMWGDNGRRYWKVRKMTYVEKKEHSDYEKKTKAGKQIWYSYKPNSLMMEFIFKYDVKAKKDKLGNINIEISKFKKGRKK